MFTKFEVDAAIVRMFPDAKMGALIGKGLDNKTPHPEIAKLLRQTEEEVRKNSTLSRSPRSRKSKTGVKRTGNSASNLPLFEVPLKLS